MENLKVNIKNGGFSDVFDLLIQLGGKAKANKDAYGLAENFLYLHDGVIWTDVFSQDEDECKEITLPELRDLVVLKRNDVGDATHIDQYGDKWFCANGVWYFYTGKNKWDESLSGLMNRYDLKPITKEEGMKEYLNKETYAYVKTHDLVSKDSNWIEIPEWAVAYADHKNGHGFFYDSFCKIASFYNIVWSRHTLPEELPFIDDEQKYDPNDIDLATGYDLDAIARTHGYRNRDVQESCLCYRESLKIFIERNPSLNDQYAEIEKVRQTLSQRQEQYGSFEDVAMITEQMVDAMRKGYYENLAYNQKMALYMICSKMARIVNGNPNHKDSWHDIAGYATLIDNELVSEKDMPF